jgi:arylsulfatase A-like enzyme
MMSKGQGEQPNILILMSDQLRFDSLGHAGHPVVRTPHLDRFAAQSLRFSQAATPTPICMAARCSFLTGRRMKETHVVENALLPGAQPVWPTLMTVLGESGYRTHGVGKFHFHRRPFGFHDQELMEEATDCLIDDDYAMYLQEQGVRTRHPQGVRDLLYYQPQTSGVPEPHSQNRWVADRSVKFLREHKRYRGNRPFMLWSSWIAPHPPFAPVEPYDEMYDPESVPMPVYTERPVSTLPANVWPHRGRLDGAHHDPDRMRRIRSLYYGQISHMDDCIGQVLNELESSGLADNTIVLFVSDHGDMLGDHGLSQKNVPYEPSLRIPMILRWPGKTAPGAECQDMVSPTDFFHTLLQELNLAYPAGLPELPGANLVRRPGGGLAEPRDHFVVDYGLDENRWVCVRNARHKYVYWDSGGLEEAYALIDDPDELKNLLIDGEPDWVPALRQAAIQYEQTQGLGALSLDNGTFRAWPAPDSIPPEDYRYININDGLWADRLPPDEQHRVETFAEAFNRAILKETTLSPDKLSVDQYIEQGGSLSGTVWEKDI